MKKEGEEGGSKVRWREKNKVKEGGGGGGVARMEWQEAFTCDNYMVVTTS